MVAEKRETTSLALIVRSVQSNLVISPPSPRYLTNLASRHQLPQDGFSSMLFTSLIRHPGISPSPRDGVITTCVCQLHPISRLVVASRSVPATPPDSVCVSGTEDKACYLVISRSGCWTVAHWPSVQLPRLKSCNQQRLWDVNGLWLTIQNGEGERQSQCSFIHSFNWCLAASNDEEGGKMRRAPCWLFTHWCSSSCRLWRPAALLWTVWAGDWGRRPAAVCH